MEPQRLNRLRQLARILKMRRDDSRPYHILLSASLSLTSALFQSVCQADSWQAFRRYLRSLGENDRLIVLSPLLEMQQHTPGYQALARLIQQGYFSTILTTNIDTELEDALEDTFHQAGLPTRSFQKLIPERDTDDYINDALERNAKGPRIIKLHGSLDDRILPPSYPDCFDLHPPIAESIKYYLHQDILIVGSLLYDDDINRALSRTVNNRIYYVLPHEPSENDSIIKLLMARNQDPALSVITGAYGDFDVFFSTLEKLLSSSEPPQPRVREKVISFDLPPRSKRPSSSSGRAPDRERADVLLVAVTDTETQAVLKTLQNTYGRSYQRKGIGNKTYLDLGEINGATVFLVQSEMSSSTPGGSMLTIFEGINALSPSAIIMVGIAFGCKPKKQQMGDILVSRQIMNYEQQRYGTGQNGQVVNIPRGDRATASVRMLDRFRSGHLDWQGANVHFGLLLSGEKLIDNLAFRQQLSQLEPEAIGGEMEGTGLYVASHSQKVDWIVVKAICDWADGQKGRQKTERQQKAASNAAQFVFHVLQNTDFVTPTS